MNNLTEFLAKYKHWFLFVLLEITSLVLLFRFNNYQGSVWFTSANIMAGKVYELSSSITSYLSMGKANKELTERNILLEHQIKELSDKLYEKTRDPKFAQKGQYRFLSNFKLVAAKVVSNSLDKDENFITIDKGSWDGGVVGVVYLVGTHYSIVLPILNSKSNISCSIEGRNYFGYLRWTGGAKDIAYLDDIPRHAKFKLGDRIITSGYSAIFPAGILVGKIKHVYNSEDGLSFRLAVQLSTDFGNLRDVCVIDDAAVREKKKVMNAATDSIKHLDTDYSETN